MPQNWLNIFSAVRGANQFEADQRQRVIDNKRADEDQGFQRDAVRREATDWDTARAERTTLGALGAYSNMVDSIENSEIAPEERPQAFAAAFDRIAPALQASGYDPQRIEGMRAELIQNPQYARDILQGLQGGSGGTQANLQAAFDANGRAVFINPRTGREAARGYAPATAVLGDRRVAISDRNADTAAGNLEQRQLDNNPEHIFDESAARAEGALGGAAAYNLPSARAAIARSADTVERLLSTDEATLQSVLGVPSLQGLFRGGAGSFGTIPGTPAADVASDIEQTVSQARLAAYESLRGGGHITEAESLFGAQAWTNLTRVRSLPAFRAELRRFQANLERADEILQSTAAPSRNPNRTPAPSRAPAASRTPAPAAGNSGGVSVDDWLQERGL